MELSNVNNMRFDGSDVKLAKIDGIIIYRKEEEKPLLKARYTANASGVVPTVNDGYVYEVNEVESNGVYTVEITSENDFSSCSFYGNSNLLTVEYLNVDKVTSMSSMFSNCTNLTSLDLSNFDTSNVNNMQNMFYNCNNLISLDLSSFDTSNVTNMVGMFWRCTNLTSLDLSSFDTSKVTSMNMMFCNCNNLISLDLSSFDTSKVTNMGDMFYNCNKLTSLDLSSFDTSNVTNMVYMFQLCSGLTSLDLSSFDTSKVANMGDMFDSCNKLTELDSMQNIRTNLSVPSALNRESILDVIDNLTDITSTATLKMSATQLSWVSEDKIIEANNKGWTISA